MSAIVKLILVTLGIIVAALILVFLVVPIGLLQYDAKTRTEWLGKVEKELKPSASKSEMEAFMKRHTTRYALDEEHHHQYGGFVEQTGFDKWMLDRKVRVRL